MKKKIGIIGHFGGKKEFFDGQTVKTKNLFNQLKKEGYNLSKLDTYNSKKRIVSILFFAVIKSVVCSDIIILPAQNGIKIFVPLFNVLSKIFKVRIHYAVVGGWLPELLKENKKLLGEVKKLYMIYPETTVMKNALSDLGITNTKILPNFKMIKRIDESEIRKAEKSPYKICTFSRVMDEKGITEAIKAVRGINEKYGEAVYELDIYGNVEDSYKEEFEKLLCEKDENVKYMGAVDSEKSVETIKEYFYLLFPTKFKTEGHPGTILDAYNAGVPVVAARWNSWSDIIDEEKTGITYEISDFEAMKNKMEYVAENPGKINSMCVNCLEKADALKPENIIKILTEEFRNQK